MYWQVKAAATTVILNNAASHYILTATHFSPWLRLNCLLEFLCIIKKKKREIVALHFKECCDQNSDYSNLSCALYEVITMAIFL